MYTTTTRRRLGLAVSLGLAVFASATAARAQVEEWGRCTDNSQCAQIARTCCACDESDYIGINSEHTDAVGHLQPNCEAVRCPQMMCQQTFNLCLRGQCIVSHEEDPATIDQEAVSQRVMVTQRAGIVQHRLEVYMSLWTQDAQIIGARGPEPGPYDFATGYDAIRRQRELTFAQPPGQVSAINWRTVSFSSEGDTATLTLETTVSGDGWSEVIGEIFRLRHIDGDWKAFENRWWPIAMGTGGDVTTYNEAFYAERDASAAVSLTARNWQEAVSQLTRGYRPLDAHAAAVQWTEVAPTDAYAWQQRGFAATMIGNVDDAILSFRRTQALEQGAFVPGWVPAE